MKGVAMRCGLGITARERSRVLDLADPAEVTGSTEPMPWPVLRGRADLIGCASVGHEARDTASHDPSQQRPETEDIDAAFGFADEAVQA